jgi:REP element-mobilizing transposase RayT
MHLSPLGILARQLWNEIINHTHNVTLGSFIIMPNHVHGILIFDSATGATEPEGSNGPTGTTGTLVGTRHALSLPGKPPPPADASNVPLKPYVPAFPSPGKTRFQNPGKNTLSSVVGSYKSALTKHAHRLQYTFEWQERFYDHVIRDTRALYFIDHYIKNNVLQWEYDRFFKKRV